VRVRLAWAFLDSPEASFAETVQFWAVPTTRRCALAPLVLTEQTDGTGAPGGGLQHARRLRLLPDPLAAGAHCVAASASAVHSQG
jgi:hypothetical protein